MSPPPRDVVESFRFDVDHAYAVAAEVFGIRVETALDNVAGTGSSGPFAFVKTAGPLHLTVTVHERERLAALLAAGRRPGPS